MGGQKRDPLILNASSYKQTEKLFWKYWETDHSGWLMRGNMKDRIKETHSLCLCIFQTLKCAHFACII